MYRTIEVVFQNENDTKKSTTLSISINIKNHKTNDFNDDVCKCVNAYFEMNGLSIRLKPYPSVHRHYQNSSLKDLLRINIQIPNNDFRVLKALELEKEL